MKTFVICEAGKDTRMDKYFMGSPGPHGWPTTPEEPQKDPEKQPEPQKEPEPEKKDD